ncbi:uncharacterized protein ARMOST_06157 [Armillaria ostoyae]|uniref:Uncharacterized protein n=1 Tax=Armillaria ostoyae TaxID=47428 RepID=A0A284R281_ARMOS|nr:uncharacterized protein ARMOST_06157 [Armillaria ostoyae]
MFMGFKCKPGSTSAYLVRWNLIIRSSGVLVLLGILTFCIWFHGYPVCISLAVACVHVDVTRFPERACGNESINTCAPCTVTRSILPSSFLLPRRCRKISQRHIILASTLQAPTLYRLPSFVLQKTTTFIASKYFAFEPDCQPIPVHEHDVVLERLLRIISGLAIPLRRRFDEFEVVLTPVEA